MLLLDESEWSSHGLTKCEGLKRKREREDLCGRRMDERKLMFSRRDSAAADRRVGFRSKSLGSTFAVETISQWNFCLEPKKIDFPYQQHFVISNSF